MGDLIATCGSSLSRNYMFGANLGKGLTVEEATKVSNGVAEGVPTTDAVVALGDQLDVPTPLAYQMSRVLNEGISCSEMLAGLLGHEVTGRITREATYTWRIRCTCKVAWRIRR